MNMTSMRIIIGVLALVAVPFVISQTGTDVESLSTDCQNKLNQIWSNYTDSAYLIESCDSDCLSACVGTLQEAIYSTKSSECPTQEDIARCFNVYGPLWTDFATECPLFNFNGTSTAVVAGEGDAGAPAPPAPILAEGEAGRRLMQGEGVVSSNSSSDGEGGSVHGGSPGPVDAGCFPYFSSVDEFNTYMKGAYWESVHLPSNTAGIIMSVFFWVGLAVMGVFLRH